MRKGLVKTLIPAEKDENGKIIKSQYWTDFKVPVTFHGWGVDYEDSGANFGNYTTAIVEYPNGTVEGVPLWRFTFDDVR